MATYAQKRLLIIFTGGTIAGNVAESTVVQSVKSDPDSFLGIVEASVATVKKNWNIEIKPEIVELFNVDSSNIVPKNWSALAAKIQETYDQYDAYVILHGTNTMGYTCAALSFALENINKPVIVTGAQVPLGYLGSDATTNLINALRLAVWGYHPVKGVMAVFGSKIISGVRVKKGTDFDYDPFSSFITGALGQIGRFMRINAAALDKHNSYLSKVKPLAIQSRTLSVKKDFDTSHIASLSEFPGMSPDLFRVLVEHAGARAFIFRSFGAGDASAHLFPGFEYLKEKEIPIMVTSQAPSGVASFQVNETGQYLKEHDLAIPAYDMSIESMTTKLGWLLAQGFGYEQIKSKMLEDLHGEINIENELL
ncbi:MAG: asparaginase [Patescibacteria group bacterium]